MNARIRKSIVRQHDQSDCGAACLATVIRYHGGNSKLESLRALSGTSKDGTTLFGLCEAAKKSGFEAEGLEAESISNLGELSDPAILHVVLDKGSQHYVVFLGFDKLQNVLIGDPAVGLVVYSKEKLDEIWKSKYLLRLKPNQSFRQEAPDGKKYFWIYSLVREDITILIASVFLGVVTAVLGLSTAMFSQRLIDDILPSGNTGNLLVGLTFVLALLISRGAVAYLRNYFIIQQATNFNNRIVQWFYGKLLRLPKIFYDTRNAGELIARINDTSRIQNSLSVIAGTLITDILVLLVSSGFVFAYSTSLGLTIVLSIPVYILLVSYFNKRVVRSHHEVMSSYAASESHFIDAIQGIANIKLFNREHFFERINKSTYGNFQNKVLDMGKLNIRFSLLTEIIGVSIVIPFLGISSWLVLTGSLQVGEMVALLSIAAGIVPAINRTVISNFQIQESRVTFDRMFDFTSMEPESEVGGQGRDPQSIVDSMSSTADIEVRDVSFGFPGRKRILRNVSFRLKHGEMTALLGECGSGKSTLVNIMQKFYQPESGRIEINGMDYSLISASTWRGLLGVVQQDVQTFNGSVLFNLTLSDDPNEQQEAISFSVHMGFDKYFSALPQGYFTSIGNDGINLSGGQKQLIGLARALFRKPRILLLDEPTASMDRNMEKFVMSLLSDLKKQVSILLITHKVAAAARADMIHILEEGTIVSHGQPNELLMSTNFFSESYHDLMSTI